MENGRNAAFNGGRGSGRTVRLISEMYENKIADLKANFDYVLEGKDLEIKELKISDEYIIKTLESKVEKLQEDLRNKRISIKNKKAEIQELIKENAELKEQNEKMKCCRICVYGGNDFGVCYSDKPCINKNKWELAKWVK